MLFGENLNLEYEYTTILSERGKGLSSSAQKNYVKTLQNKYVFHINANLVKRFGGNKDLKLYFYKCASSPIISGHIYFMYILDNQGKKFQ